MSFSIDPNVISLLAQAHRQDPRILVTLNGDLLQMSRQANFLRQRGFEVTVSGGIPGLVSEDDAKRAFKLLWDCKVEGWWNSQYEFVKYGICSQEEFLAALKAL